MTHEKLVKMNLHDSIVEDITKNTYVIITRVNKGWTYTYITKSFCDRVGEQLSSSTTFVPR